VNAESSEIGDGEALLRRIANKPNMLKRDGDVVRPTSAAFKPAGSDGGVSVDVRSLLPDPGVPTSVLALFPGQGLVELSARGVRERALDVVHAPLSDNDAHANIIGWDRMSKPDQKRAQRELALAAAWVRQPVLAS
jgi:hypothetical protein